jgi:hypothetical protein
MRKQLETFAERLLSTKLVTLVVMWVACFISFWNGKMIDAQFVTATLGIGGLIVAASYVDKKTEGTLFNGENKNV